MLRRALVAVGAAAVALSGMAVGGPAPAAGFEPGLTCPSGSGSVHAKRPMVAFPADPRPTKLLVRVALDHCSGSGAIASGVIRVRLRLRDNACPLVPPASADGRAKGVVVWRDDAGKKVERSRVDSDGSLVYDQASETLGFVWTFEQGQVGGPAFSGAGGFVSACLAPSGFTALTAPPASVRFLA
jgi:hypothetical protein